MKNKYPIYSILLLSSALLFTSCKKEYTCTCTDSSSGDKNIAFTEKTTEGKASSKCDQHYNSTYGSVPFNDVSCSIE